MRILTWHVHGSYLYYLTQVPHTFSLPVKAGWPDGIRRATRQLLVGRERGGCARRGGARSEVRLHPLSVAPELREDQYDILSEAQRRLPRLYLEHDPPRESPDDTRHPVDDPDVLLVHVTHFNDLMWDSGRTPTRVIEHGVILPAVRAYTAANWSAASSSSMACCSGGGGSARMCSCRRASHTARPRGHGVRGVGGLGDVRRPIGSPRL